MRKICSVLLALSLLFSFALAEDLAGSWRFIGGGELLGDGFELYADGTGQLLYTEDYAVFPSRHFYAQDDHFTWQVQGDTLYLSFEDGREWNYPIHMEGDVLAVESLDTDGSGGFPHRSPRGDGTARGTVLSAYCCSHQRATCNAQLSAFDVVGKPCFDGRKGVSSRASQA